MKQPENSADTYPNKEQKELFEAILKLKTADETARFFRDLLTIAELQEFSNRWKMAKMIDLGLPYQKIAEEVGCSTTTVTRTAHWLNHGMNGYRLILDRVKKRNTIK